MERSPSFLEKIGSLVPGYAGYADREGRRQCDKILRSQVSVVLQQARSVIEERLATVIAEKKFELMADLEQCRKRLDTLAEKVKYAPYGESSFFSDAQVRGPELEEIYRTDLELMEKVKAFMTVVSEQPVTVALASVREMEAMLSNRTQYMKEFK